MKDVHRARIHQGGSSRGRINLISVLILALILAGRPIVAPCRQLPKLGESEPHAASTTDPCKASTPSALRETLRLVCSREPVEATGRSVRKAIIIGFVGGFTKRDDTKHPEVLFADYLLRRYGPGVHAEVFGNHEWKQALEDTLRWLDTDKEGFLPDTENEQASIILYGHSWGASQTLAFARELQRHSISVAMTIQIDSVKKFGQDDRTVPSNVAKAVNFYQRGGLTPGQPRIVAADPEQTRILGNFRMSYKDAHINCDNYRWLSRVFNKGHHQIENDPRIWDRIATLIDSELLRINSAVPPVHAVSSPSPPSD